MDTKWRHWAVRTTLYKWLGSNTKQVKCIDIFLYNVSYYNSVYDIKTFKFQQSCNWRQLKHFFLISNYRHEIIYTLLPFNKEFLHNFIIHNTRGIAYLKIVLHDLGVTLGRTIGWFMMNNDVDFRYKICICNFIVALILNSYWEYENQTSFL